MDEKEPRQSSREWGFASALLLLASAYSLPERLRFSRSVDLARGDVVERALEAGEAAARRGNELGVARGAAHRVLPRVGL